MFFTLEEARLRKEAADLELVKEMSHLLSSEHVRGNVHLLTNSVKHSCLVQSTRYMEHEDFKVVQFEKLFFDQESIQHYMLYVLIMSW